MVLDVFTRCILGFYLCYEPPSHASVAAALKHAIMPKEMHAGIHGHWPMHGIPSLMVVDNGLEAILENSVAECLGRAMFPQQFVEVVFAEVVIGQLQ